MYHLRVVWHFKTPNRERRSATCSYSKVFHTITYKGSTERYCSRKGGGATLKGEGPTCRKSSMRFLRIHPTASEQGVENRSRSRTWWRTQTRTLLQRNRTAWGSACGTCWTLPPACCGWAPGSATSCRPPRSCTARRRSPRTPAWPWSPTLNRWSPGGPVSMASCLMPLPA